MTQDLIKTLLAERTREDGLTETGIEGVQLFRATGAFPCSPVVYEPCIVAILNGTKEVVLDGQRYLYDNRRYLCCPMSMPVKAGTPNASPEHPLLGVLISLNHRAMTELTVEMETTGGALPVQPDPYRRKGIQLAQWDPSFTDALLRLIQILDDPMDCAVLGPARLREVLYAILKGEAGGFARRAFGPGHAIARSIAHASSNLGAPISIDDLASRAGMSRAAFHRKFKQVTTMAPIQFIKSMRLNTAAMKIASGININEAAFDVGYVSSSQFSREFKRLYGQSPKQWSRSHQSPTGVV